MPGASLDLIQREFWLSLRKVGTKERSQMRLAETPYNSWVETQSLPSLRRCCARGFVLYLANLIP